MITKKFDKKKSKQSEHLHTDPLSNGPTQRIDMGELGIVLETEKERPQQKFIQKTDKSLFTEDNLGDIEI